MRLVSGRVVPEGLSASLHGGELLDWEARLVASRPEPDAGWRHETAWRAFGDAPGAYERPPVDAWHSRMVRYDHFLRACERSVRALFGDDGPVAAARAQAYWIAAERCYRGLA